MNLADTDITQILYKGNRLRARKVINCLDEVLTDPTPAATHDLSTSLRRLLMGHQVTNQLYRWKLFRKKDLSQIQIFRRQLGNVRDIQEITLKIQNMTPVTNAAKCFLNNLIEKEIDVTQSIVAAIQALDHTPIVSCAEVTYYHSLLQATLKKSLPDLITNSYTKVASLFESAVMGSDDQALHQMRVRYKRLRYSIELLAPALVDISKAKLAYLRSFQQILGEAHDWLIIDEAIKEYILNTGQTEVDQLMLKIEQLRFDAHQKARKYFADERSNLQFFISSITSK